MNGPAGDQSRDIEAQKRVWYAIHSKGTGHRRIMQRHTLGFIAGPTGSEVGEVVQIGIYANMSKYISYTLLIIGDLLILSSHFLPWGPGHPSIFQYVFPDSFSWELLSDLVADFLWVSPSLVLGLITLLGIVLLPRRGVYLVALATVLLSLVVSLFWWLYAWAIPLAIDVSGSASSSPGALEYMKRTPGTNTWVVGSVFALAGLIVYKALAARERAPKDT